jgi:hypothetical protein
MPGLPNAAPVIHDYEVYTYFNDACFLLDLLFDTEVEGRAFFRNVGKLLTDHRT